MGRRRPSGAAEYPIMGVMEERDYVVRDLETYDELDRVEGDELEKYDSQDEDGRIIQDPRKFEIMRETFNNAREKHIKNMKKREAKSE